MSQEVPDKCKGCPLLVNYADTIRENDKDITLLSASLDAIRIASSSELTDEQEQKDIKEMLALTQSSLVYSRTIASLVLQQVESLTAQCDGVEVQSTPYPTQGFQFECGSTLND